MGLVNNCGIQEFWDMDKTKLNCSGIREVRELIPEGRNIQEGWKFQKMEIWHRKTMGSDEAK